MTILTARIRQLGRWIWAGAFVTGTIVIVTVAYVFGRRHGKTWDQTQDALDATVSAHGRRVSIANARAAVEIAAVRMKEGAERDELLAALAIGDEDEQIERLIELGRKVRGE